MHSRNVDFERLFHDLPGPYMVLDTDLYFIDMNQRYLETVGRTREELIGHHVFEAFPEDEERLALFKAAFEKALLGERNALLRARFSIRDAASQTGAMKEVWWNCHQLPVYNDDELICGVLQRAEDITEQVRAERMRDTVLKELDHRIKNHLATILAIAHRTARDASSPAAFIEAFDERIAAMARTHQMLVDGNWSGLGLSELIASELAPFGLDESGHLMLSGPAVSLSNAQAQSLSLAIHELTTNAAKYGALRVPSASLNIGWRIEKDKNLVFEWHETGVSGITPPTRKGFGSTILDKVLPSEIDAAVERAFMADGMRCEIRFALEAA